MKYNDLRNFAEQLNTVLQSTDFQPEDAHNILTMCKYNTDITLCYIDTTKHNAEQLSIFSEKKKNYIHENQHEAAATMRDNERYCRMCDNILQYYNLENSVFVAKDKALYYLYTGKGPNDAAMLETCIHHGFIDGFRMFL